ncbi:TPA: zinc-ribbon domain-containing protein [Streptococcus suis]|uniref:zinc ribbon domain-containing protein n=1 Tax=Streptococcus suis TaxID=1307 RepID=UPI00375ED9B0
MFCSKCGAQNKADSKFCMSCGNALSVGDASNSGQPSANSNLGSQQKLGESPDFYTYLAAILVVIMLFLQFLSPGISVLIGFLALFSAFKGRNVATNRSLHTIILVSTIIVFLIVFNRMLVP